MAIDTITAQSSIKNLNAESFSLNPTALINLFEIDISTLGFNLGQISSIELSQQVNTIFRFHNNSKLGNNSIFWRGNEYIMIPISAEGFEINSKGTLPVPKLTLSVSEEGVPLLSILKDRINQLAGDLSGAKFTRIRTFAKYLDRQNFFNDIPPIGFSPDPNSEFPKDVYYIDRIVAQNKNYIQFMEKIMNRFFLTKHHQ
jgi:lambda family phage minor tail protein L